MTFKSRLSIIVDCLHGLRSPGCDRPIAIIRIMHSRGALLAGRAPAPACIACYRDQAEASPAATHPCESRRCGALERLLPLGDSAV